MYGIVVLRLGCHGFDCSYLASRNELQWAQRAFQIWYIVLEISQSLGDVSIVFQSAQWMGRLALAMLVSISDGFCLEGLLGAILFNEADMLAADFELIVSITEVLYSGFCLPAQAWAQARG